jgi:hypothetical protein
MVQRYTVYGRVPAQTMPAAATYTDTEIGVARRPVGEPRHARLEREVEKSGRGRKIAAKRAEPLRRQVNPDGDPQGFRAGRELICPGNWQLSTLTA